MKVILAAPGQLSVTSRKHQCLKLLNIFTEFQVEKVSTKENDPIETFTKSKTPEIV